MGLCMLWAVVAVSGFKDLGKYPGEYLWGQWFYLSRTWWFASVSAKQVGFNEGGIAPGFYFLPSTPFQRPCISHAQLWSLVPPSENIYSQTFTLLSLKVLLLLFHGSLQWHPKSFPCNIVGRVSSYILRSPINSMLDKLNEGHMKTHYNQTMERQRQR